MIEDAILCLKNQYNENRPYVEGNDFFTYYFNEKQRHSMQVFGAGNMLVRHIDWLKNKPAEYIEMVRTAVLLHDVYRFKEIALKATENKNIDHGIEGAEFLRNIPQFSDIRIWLPIYHHGHLIEA
ncbi:MAG: HD domain-containing protein, partial [Alphaproteobacteria bacterium]|nr:HD domain-containing protein [Alphaproteobacteria bacterium]